mgnify:FL=1
MTTPVNRSRLAPFRLAPCTALLALLVAGCQPEAASDDTGDTSDPVDTDDSGSVELALAVRSLSYTRANPGPTQAVLDVRIPTEATVQLVLNDELIEEWDTGDSCVVFPAFTQCADYLDQSLPVMIETGGEQHFELTALKGSDWKTVTFERDLTLEQCIANAAFYDEIVQPVLDDACSSCHREGGDGSSVFWSDDPWATFETTILNRREDLYQAPSLQTSMEQHRRRQIFQPYSTEYRAIAESVWRTLTSFQCS